MMETEVDWTRWLIGVYIAPIEVLIFVGPFRLSWTREKRWQEYRALFTEDH